MKIPTTRMLVVEDLIASYDIIGSVDDFLKDSQIAGILPIPGIPKGAEEYLMWSDYNDPLPPEDLTVVDDLGVGKLFSFFQNWTNYVACEVTRAKSMKDIQDEIRKVSKAALAIYYRTEVEVPAGLVDEYVTVDERHVEVSAAYFRIKSFYEAAHSREAQLRRTLNNISREQTRRKEELERQLHDEYGGRGPTEPVAAHGHAERPRFRFGRHRE